MWWIFQEAEQLFSILPPPPQIMLNSGRLRLALQKGKHLLLSRLLPFPQGKFFHQVQPKRVIQEGNDSEIKELPIKRDLTPNPNWHSEGDRDLPEVFLHIFPGSCCPCLSQWSVNCTRGLYWLSLEITAPNGSGTFEHLSGVSWDQ